MQPLNAVDAIPPAMTRAVALLFRPFRWGFWWRLAILTILTGEYSGGNFNLPADLGERGGSKDFLARAWPFGPEALPIVIGLGIALLGLMLVLIYLGSVLRFVLLDAVLNGRYRLREGWDRWHGPGTRFFWWALGYMVVMLAVLGFFVLLVVGSVTGMKLGKGTSVLLFVFALLAGLFALALAALTWVLTKDFVVPIMAFERVGALEAWSKLWAMIRGDFVAYLGYIGMKIVLAIGAAIAVGIASVILLLVLLLPAVVFGAVIAVGLKLSWTPATIALAVVVGGVALAFLMWLLALIATPATVFFQAYAIQFFGTRYAPMRQVLYPEPPAPVPPPAPA